MNMETKSVEQHYWNNRYETQQTGWDLGQVSPPLKAYIDQLPNKDLRILIMGCGNAYEADYLLEKGFSNVTLLDIAPLLVQKLQEKYKNSTHIQVILGDFFEHHGQYDLILEQTFVSAIPPIRRPEYAKKISELLVSNGQLVGILFDKEFDLAGPPFGGSIQEYQQLFSPFFKLKVFEKCYNSIEPRHGSEIFINLKKA